MAGKRRKLNDEWFPVVQVNNPVLYARHNNRYRFEDKPTYSTEICAELPLILPPEIQTLIAEYDTRIRDCCKACQSVYGQRKLVKCDSCEYFFHAGCLITADNVLLHCPDCHAYLGNCNACPKPITRYATQCKACEKLWHPACFEGDLYQSHYKTFCDTCWNSSQVTCGGCEETSSMHDPRFEQDCVGNYLCFYCFERYQEDLESQRYD